MFQEELKQSVGRLQGIGPKTSAALSRIGIHSVSDILKYYPRSYENRLDEVDFTAAFKSSGQTIVNTSATVTAHEYFGWGKKQTLKILLNDNKGIPASLICFGRNFLAEKLKEGTSVLVFGTFSVRYNELQSTAFDFEIIPELFDITAKQLSARNISDSFGRILPVYPLTSGLTQKGLRKAVRNAVDQYGKFISTELPENIILSNGLMSKADAVEKIHFPERTEDTAKAELTLKYEELFHFQMAAARRALKRREAGRRSKTGIHHPERNLHLKLIDSLPFSLTDGQNQAIDEILEDLDSERPMARLLQGDVGCGKTLVAFISALRCIENGMQCAFMAPTELLARQHADNADRLLSPLGIRVALLSGSVKKDKRELLLKALTNGEVDLLIGTHALFGDDINFKKLGLAVIDEQQRFGVLQRTALSEKNTAADLLLMTATPIPRTLAMTVFGDMDVTTIKSMPPGRSPVETHLAALGREEKVYQFIKKQLSKGRQAYFVYPLISSSDKIELKDAESMFSSLKDEIFPEHRVELIHSRIDENEKKKIMDEFHAGEVRILVATSVVEVGVDVPNANCMVIEHAERFGLSALHQLRGRVGRGEHQSYAFLVYSPELTEAGTARLKVMKESTDGFLIAEEDLRIRGPGDLAGSAQSGFMPFTIADLNTDFDLLKKARVDVRQLMDTDPGLLQPQNSVLRKLFETCPPFSNMISGE